MKTSRQIVLQLLALAVSPLALACPNLAGDYVCGVMQTTRVHIVDAGPAFNVGIQHFYTSNPGAAQNASYNLSKTGLLTVTLEGVGETNLPMKSICEGNDDLRLDGDIMDPILGKTHIMKKISVDANHNLVKLTSVVYPNGSTQNGAQEVCLRR